MDIKTIEKCREMVAHDNLGSVEPMGIFHDYSMALGYSPWISHPDLGYIGGPGMPTWDEYVAHVEETVAKYREG